MIDVIVYKPSPYGLVFIRHINPLMFDVIDDKPEGVARGFYHV